MRPAAEVMADLAATGLSAAQVALVMELSATVAAEARPMDNVSAQRRRAKDREYQAEKRRQNRQISADSDDIADQVSLDKKEPHTPKKLNPSHVCETRAWHRLPEGWTPRPLPSPVQAKVDLWPPGALEDELASFRRWAANAANTNGKGRKLDWDQAWRNWIGRRHDERQSRTHPVGRYQPNDGLSENTRAARDVFGLELGAGH